MLTETAIKNAKPKEKPYKLADERGLFLAVQPSGAKWWRFRYYIWGKERMLSLGTYPDISLKQARERRDTARSQVADGIDPSDVKKQQKHKNLQRFDDLVTSRVDELKLRAATMKKKRRVLGYLIAELGSRPVHTITTQLAHEALKRISARGPDVAREAYTLLDDTMLDAKTMGLITENPVTGLYKKLPKPKRQSHAAIIEPKVFGQLLKDIDGYTGQPQVRYAMQLLALTFVRPNELLEATWPEFDLDNNVWVIPPARTKQKRDHLVPLVPQALAILELAKAVKANPPSKYVLPGLRPGKPLSGNTVNSALRSLGYAGHVHVSHGFRSSASTMLNEQLKVPMEPKELQLGHWRPGDWGTYDRAELLDERRAMMEKWATYLDKLRGKAPDDA